MDAVIEGEEIGYGRGYCFGVINTTTEILQVHGDIHLPDGNINVRTNQENRHKLFGRALRRMAKACLSFSDKSLKQAWGFHNGEVGKPRAQNAPLCDYRQTGVRNGRLELFPKQSSVLDLANLSFYLPYIMGRTTSAPLHGHP